MFNPTFMPLSLLVSPLPVSECSSQSHLLCVIQQQFSWDSPVPFQPAPLPSLDPGSAPFTVTQLRICDHLLLKFISMSNQQKEHLFLSKWKLFSSAGGSSRWLPHDRGCHLYPCRLPPGVTCGTSLPVPPHRLLLLPPACSSFNHFLSTLPLCPTWYTLLQTLTIPPKCFLSTF